jgi:hypothetical protein
MWLDKQQAIDLDKVRIELPAQEQYAPQAVEPPLGGAAPDAPPAPGDPAAKAPDGEQDSADAIQRELLRRHLACADK